MSHPIAVELSNITKRFGPLTANQRVNFTLHQGEIHALLGENGAGKSTLMRVLYGLYQPDEGEVHINGQQVTIRSPKDAIAHGIGMVSQHFALVYPLSVTENVILGQNRGVQVNLAAGHVAVKEAATRFGIEIDPSALIKNLSVGQRQRVEILKALYRNAKVLILDEPTAVLTPQEVEQLFATLRRLQENGLSVIFISHKLNEVMAITDRVSVLRGGKLVDTAQTKSITQQELAKMMVGERSAEFGMRSAESALPKSPNRPVAQSPILSISNLSAYNNQSIPALSGVSLDIFAGEIVGLAGVSGNGQVELAQVLSGTRAATAGSVRLAGTEIANATPQQVMAAGLGRIPEDRHASIVGEMSVAHNAALEHLDEFTRNGRLDHAALRKHAETLIAEYQIKAKPDDKIRTLSGGNIQKVLLARVIERNPKAIVVAQPTRGLDLGATGYVRNKLREQRDKGAAILLISEDLDELLELADRVAVIYEGKIVGVMPVAEATLERLGLLMAGVK